MRNRKAGFGRLRLLGGLGLVFLATPWLGCASAAPRQSSASIVGSYEASFTTRGGITREGTLKISPLGKLLYWLEWRDARETYSGRGALAGDALLAVWGSSSSRCLAAMLEVDPDGVLRGIWFRAEDRNGAARAIEARPLAGPGPDIAGAFSIVDASRESSGLPRELEIDALGGGDYAFLWTGDEQLAGRGRLQDGMILVVSSVAGSGDKCRISEMKLAADGSLSWSWLAEK